MPLKETEAVKVCYVLLRLYVSDSGPRPKPSTFCDQLTIVYRVNMSNMPGNVLTAGCTGDTESFPGVLSFVSTQGMLFF